MGKIRAGSVKSKPKIHQDFKKKTAKVGKKVARSNVTEIKIQSKRINIPLQSTITARAPSDEQEVLEKLLKQLHHYSAPSRVAALEELKALLSASAHGESYISLVFPKALELLFDDDYMARRALMVLLTLLLSKYKSMAFTSIISIAITYICSGLTSLNRGVMRDSLGLLQLLADTHSSLLTPYLEKLLVHILSLLTTSGHTTQSKISSNGVLTIGKAAAASASSTSSSGSSSSSSSSSNTGAGGDGDRGGKDGTGKANASDGPSGPCRSEKDAYSCLCVISTLLSCAAQSTGLFEGERDGKKDELPEMKHADDSSILLLRARYRKCRWFETVGQQHIFHTYNNKGDMHSYVTEDNEWLSDSILLDLCSRLRTMWIGLVLEESKLSSDVVPTLREIAKIAYILGLAGEGSRMAEYRLLVGSIFCAFPHKSLEAGVAGAGSSAESLLNKNVYALDVTLCSVSLLFLADTTNMISQYDAGVQAAVSKAKDYILICLMRHIGEIENASAADIMDAAEEVDENAGVEKEDEEEEYKAKEYPEEEGEDGDGEADEEKEMQVVSSKSERKKKYAAKSAVAKPSSVDNIEIATRMYSSLHVMALAGDCSDPVIKEVLEMMRRLVQATASSLSATIRRQTLLNIIRPGILCLCSIAINPVLWTRGYGLAVLEPLVSSLVVSISLMVRWPKEPGGEMTSALLQAMLTILRKMQLDDAEKGMSTQGASLCECIYSLFSTAITYSNETPTKSSKSPPAATFYTLCQPGQRITLLDLYFHAPFADVLAISRVVATNLAAISHKSSSAAQEQQHQEMQYFLRLFYERRSHFNLSGFFDVLFTMLRLSISSRCKRFPASADLSQKVAKALTLADRWTAHEIADVLLWCSSADAPFKILTFLAPAIEKVACNVSGSLHEKSADQLLEKWLLEHLTANAVISIVMALLRPCLTFSGVDGSSDAEVVDAESIESKDDVEENRALVQRSCQLLAKIIVNQSAAYGQAVSLGAETSSVQSEPCSIYSQDVQWRLYKTAALCLATATPLMINNNVSPGMENFHIFECFLRQILVSWSDSQTTSNCRKWLLKGMKFFLTFNCLASPQFLCKGQLQLTLNKMLASLNEGDVCEHSIRQMLREV